MYDRKNLKTDSTYVLNGVRFDLNKAEITSEGAFYLKKLADFLKANPDISIQIGGHTNNFPGTAFANKLSTNRAKAVADWLVAHGIPQECVQFKGFGKTKPIANIKTPEGRKQNVRVDMTILEMNP